MNPNLWLPELLLIILGAGLGYHLFGPHTDESEIDPGAHHHKGTRAGKLS